MEVDKLIKVNQGDLFKTESGKLGIVINFTGRTLNFITQEGKVAISDVTEVRRPSELCKVNWASWSYAAVIVPPSKTAFLGISYQANDKLVQETRDILKSNYTVIEYDDTMSLDFNNSKVSSCDIHVIVPPESFDQDHIIGYGLYQQILTRQKSGGKTMISANCGMPNIKKIYKLEGSNKIKSALVLY